MTQPSQFCLQIIIPKSPSGHTCGLADHSSALAEQLQLRGWDVVIAGLESMPADCQRPLLLQYTPYAYSRLGLPLALLCRLMLCRLRISFRCRRPRPSILTFFHELPFLNRAGWKGRLVLPLQAFFCILVAGLSTEVLVNQTSAISWLGLLRPFSPPLFLPSWSNVGEALDPLEYQQRPLQVVIFGSPGKRRHAHHLVAQLGGYRHLFGSDVQVLDIGELGQLPSTLAHEVTTTGPLQPDEVRQILLRSRFGWFYAEPDQVSKSGVFAAYCALGVLPIVAFPDAPPAAAYLSPCELPIQAISSERVQTLANHGRAWFHQHNLSQGADSIITLLQPC